MKTKLLLFALFLMGSLSLAKAQYINETPIYELRSEYVRMWESGRTFSRKIKVDVEIGSESKSFAITDDKKREIPFNNMVDALNLMAENGYELLQITPSEDGKQAIYILRRTPHAFRETTPYRDTDSDFSGQNRRF